MATIGGRLTSQIYYFGARRLRARGSLLFVIPPAMCYRVYTYAYACTRGGGREGGGNRGRQAENQAEKRYGGPNWEMAGDLACFITRRTASTSRSLSKLTDESIETAQRIHVPIMNIPLHPPSIGSGGPLPASGGKKKKKEKRNEDASRINK